MITIAASVVIGGLAMVAGALIGFFVASLMAAVGEDTDEDYEVVEVAE